MRRDWSRRHVERDRTRHAREIGFHLERWLALEPENARLRLRHSMAAIDEIEDWPPVLRPILERVARDAPAAWEAWYALAYMTTASLGGRLSDRVPRLTLARAGGALFFLGCLALSQAPGKLFVFLALPVLGLGLGFFWSPVQAALSDRAAG